MSSPAETLLKKVNPRAGPLIISVFGDTIAPRGGAIWLGSLIELMAPFGLSERLVRTGVYRLAREGWLVTRQQGRRSFYSITEQGMSTFADADARIYATGPPAWNGKWTSVQILPDATARERREIRNILTWHGFGQLSPTMMIKPGTATSALTQALHDNNVAKACILMTGGLHPPGNSKAATNTRIVKNGWDLGELSDSYGRLLKCFGSIDTPPETPQDAFAIRTLLIHQYRRILLKDPQLPQQLLPSHWTGESARHMVANTYRLLTPATDAFATDKMQCGEEKCPKPNQAYFKRFSLD